jgi:Holliday junction resolvasome RuvABC DNA-binding subunit
MENFWSCIVISGLVSFFVNLGLSRFARDKTITELGRILATKPKTVETVEAREARDPARHLRTAPLDRSTRRVEGRGQLKAALLNLGWKATEIEKCITAFGSRIEQEDIGALLREAIGKLAS